MKGAIIYKGKYGATSQYANWLGEELSLPVLETENAGPEIISELDFLVLGASVYMGRTRHKEWLVQNAASLQGKKLFYFIVCGTPLSEKQKLEQLIEKNIPTTLLQPASAWFLPGRIIVKALSWKDRMMLKIGAKMEKNPEVKKNMLKDFDEVRIENLGTMIKAIMMYTKQGKETTHKLQDAGMA